jgi:hypothetical protein
MSAVAELTASRDDTESRDRIEADLAARITSALDSVEAWVIEHDYKGYDPGDGLTSWARPLTLGHLFGERVLQQIVWKAPFNLRPLLGIKPLDSTKGRGFMAWGHLLRHAATGSPEEMRRALACLDWLVENRSPAETGYAWGNHFDFSTRSGRMPAQAPTIVWTGLIGQAFLEAYEQTHDERHLTVATRICDWILSLPRERTGQGSCLSYVAYEQSSIHNSNMLGAGLLARAWHHTGRAEFAEAAEEAVAYTIHRQREDGSWFYGEEPRYRWIDNFHTGYVLDSLKRFIDYTGRQDAQPAMLRGYDYFKRTFFDPAGRPAYYPGRAFPVDIQCAAQAIDTFALFADEDTEGLAHALRVATWTIGSMRDPSGYFYYRLYPRMVARTPYFHWGQATMFKGLAHLALRLGQGDPLRRGGLRDRQSPTAGGVNQ